SKYCFGLRLRNDHHTVGIAYHYVAPMNRDITDHHRFTYRAAASGVLSGATDTYISSKDWKAHLEHLLTIANAAFDNQSGQTDRLRGDRHHFTPIAMFTISTAF